MFNIQFNKLSKIFITQISMLMIEGYFLLKYSHLNVEKSCRAMSNFFYFIGMRMLVRINLNR